MEWKIEFSIEESRFRMVKRDAAWRIEQVSEYSSAAC